MELNIYMWSFLKKKNHKSLFWISLMLIGFLIIICALFFSNISHLDVERIGMNELESMNGNVVFIKDGGLTSMEGNLEFLELESDGLNGEHESFKGVSLKTDTGHVEFIELKDLRLIDGEIDFVGEHGLRSMDGYFEFLSNGDLKLLN